MEKSITWVGLDAHKKSIVVAALLPGRREPEQWQLENTPRAVERLVKKLEKESSGGEIRCCYEAGPCGYALQRQIEKGGRAICEVIAPSLVPSKPGDRIKTDRRDATKLVQLLKAGLLTTVQPPSEEQEAVRDLCRCREDAREDLHRVRHRLLKFLLRRGHIFNETSRPWSQKHRRWVKAIKFEDTVDQSVLDEYLLAVEQTEQRLKALDQKLEEAARLPIYKEPVAWLRCFRGIDTITAMIFAAELHGIERFDSPRKLAASWASCPQSIRARRRPGAAALRRPATATSGGLWSRPAGSTGTELEPAESWLNGDEDNQHELSPSQMPRSDGCTAAMCGSPSEANPRTRWSSPW